MRPLLYINHNYDEQSPEEADQGDERDHERGNDQVDEVEQRFPLDPQRELQQSVFVHAAFELHLSTLNCSKS